MTAAVSLPVPYTPAPAPSADGLEAVRLARQWLGTPFHHQARLKGVGVDCVGLVIGVAREMGLVPPDFDVTAYPRTPDGVTLMQLSGQHMTRIPASQMRVGSVGVFSLDNAPQHFGFVADYRHGGFSLVHASGSAGRVIETRLMLGPALRLVAAFELARPA